MTVLVMLAVTSIPAKADTFFFWGNVCYNGAHCLNQAQGQRGGQIVFYSHTTAGEPNNDWTLLEEANNTVDCATGFPFGGFVPQSVCDSWGVNGRHILKLEWTPNMSGTGYCLWQGAGPGSNYNGSDTAVSTTSCPPANSGRNYYLFVYTTSHYLLAAGATAYNFLTGGNQKRAYLGPCDYAGEGAGNGSPVCLTTSFPLDFEFLNVP